MNKELLPSIELLNNKSIENCIYNIRGMQVMLDRDIARLFNVETKRLNEQMKRNVVRFPDDFCIKLNSLEFKSLRSQNATFNVGYSNNRHLPYAYTEHGIIALSGILKSEIAARMSVEIARAFVKMRAYFLSNKDILVTRSEFVEFKEESTKRIDNIINRIERIDLPVTKLFFDGQLFDAYEFIVDIIKKANKSIELIDPYLDDKSLSYLSHRKEGVVISLITSDKAKLNNEEISRYMSQYGEFAIKYDNKIHDRFLIIDNEECYHLGTSLNHSGEKLFIIIKIENEEIIDSIIKKVAIK